MVCMLPVAAIAQIDHEYYGRPSYWRPYDQRGINVFETSKTPDTLLFEGAKGTLWRRLYTAISKPYQYQHRHQQPGLQINCIPSVPAF